jgi:hypothetical protein
MIISDKIRVKSSIYYRDRGYDINEKYITVDIKDVPFGSRAFITAICDFCNHQKDLTYKDYNNNIKKGNKYACSIKCGSIKAKETNMEKIGAESHFQLDDFKESSKNKLLQKWGVDHISRSEIISKKKSEKMKMRSSEVSDRIKKYYSSLSDLELGEINKKRENTNLKKWGLRYTSQVDSIKEKIKKTNLERWGGYTFESEVLSKRVKQTNIKRFGVDNPLKSDSIKEKIKKTNLERWGVDNPLKSDSIKEKIKKTNLERFGVDNPFKLDFIKEEIRRKFIDKYGTDSYFKTDNFKNSKFINLSSTDDWRICNFEISKNNNYIKYIGSNCSEFKCDLGNNHNFIINSSNYYNRKRLNKNLCTICFPISDTISISENEIKKYIQSIYNGEIIQSWRDGLEIDIYLPEFKLGFEFNGLYWHSNKYKEKNYHLDKTNYFKEKGIRIIHIWEDDWNLKKDIIKSQIINLIGLSSKIWARKCKIKEITDIKLVKDFLNNNHIQGYTKSSLKIGLYYEEELVSMMIFDNIEGRYKMEEGGWNLSRFCSKKNTSIIGGASKILKYFTSEYSPKRIISYADMDWSNGELYHILKFKLINTLKPDYKYIVDGKRLNKQSFTKSKLKKIGFDVSLTEGDITKNMGIEKVYNVGQLKFELNF